MIFAVAAAFIFLFRYAVFTPLRFRRHADAACRRFYG